MTTRTRATVRATQYPAPPRHRAQGHRAQVHRAQVHRAQGHRAQGYPHDYLHENRTYEQTQADVGGSLLLGGLTLVVLMTLIVLGLV